MRSTWTGTVGFGMVAIPVKLGAMTGREEGVLHELRRTDGSRIRYQKIAEADGKPVDQADIVKGYETATGQKVIVSKDDLDAAYGPSTKNAEIVMFTDAAAVPGRVAHEASYIVQPDKGGERSYELLAAAMERTGKVAVVRFAMRDRGDSYALLYPLGGGYLVLERLQWAARVRKPDFEAPRTGVSEAETELAVGLITQLDGAFDWQAQADDSAAKLNALIQGKIETGQLTGEPVSRAPGAATAPADLADVLRASVEQAKAARTPAPKTRAPRKPRAPKASAA